MTVKGTVSYADKVKCLPDFQEKEVQPSTERQVIYPDDGFDGINKLVLGVVTAAVDPDIIPENIKEGVNILGVVGTLKDNLQAKTVVPSRETQEIVPDSGYTGLSSVTVEAVQLQERVVYPDVVSVTCRPDDGYTGLSEVTVKAVTYEIDPNIRSENIKKGVDILGITGTCEEGFEVVDRLDASLTSGDLIKIFRTIKIPSGVTAIGSGAFNGCGGLESIEIPVSVTSIGQGAFDGCTALADVYYGGTQEQWESVSGNEALTSADIHYQGGGT